MTYEKVMKYCPKCKKVKFIHEFGYSSKDGLQSYCKECKASYQKENRDKKLNWQKKYRNENRTELLEKRKDYYRTHVEQESDYGKRWSKNNRPKLRARDAKRRSAKLQRTPSWAKLDKIQEIYQNCPEGYQVDHIVPLQGASVSGLHVEYNLQYLPAKENLSKGNKWLT